MSSSSSSPPCTSFPVPDILRSVRPAPLIRDALDPFKVSIQRQYHKCSAGSCLPHCPENERIHVSPDSPWGNTWSVRINDMGTTVLICRDTGAFRGCSGSPVEPCNGCTEEPCRHYKTLRGILVGAERVPWKWGEGETKKSQKKRGREKEGESSSQESTLDITKADVLKRLKSHLDTLTEKISEVQRDILRVRCAETKAQECELELFQQLGNILPSGNVTMHTVDLFLRVMFQELSSPQVKPEEVREFIMDRIIDVYRRNGTEETPCWISANEFMRLRSEMRRRRRLMKGGLSRSLLSIIKRKQA